MVNYAKEHGRNKMATHFGHDNKSMVERWVKASVNWTSKINRNIKKIGPD